MSVLLTFYGDDFTGSTDALEVLAAAGIPTVLFLVSPDAAHIARFPEARVIGVAGISRSQDPAWMDQHLPTEFERLKTIGAPLCHYKVCSTFDSAPHVGNIGRAAEIGRAVFGGKPVPVVVGAPALGRFVVFGNLFATASGVTYRIDRHPVMSRHPTTPTHEADLRRHLAAQTRLRSVLVDHVALNGTMPASAADADAELVVFDTVDVDTQTIVGRLLWEGGGDQPGFVIGSSGVEFALVRHWRDLGLVPDSADVALPTPVDRIVALSGSCSPTTETQIRRALVDGFADLRLDPVALIESEAAMEAATARAVSLLADAKSPILYTALGPDDRGGASPTGLTDIAFNTRLGERLGMVFRNILRRSGIRRAVVAGGDTSGHVTNQLGLHALTYQANLVRGCPLCRAHADQAAFDGIELALKGGQMGGESFFSQVLRGTL